MKKIMIVDDDRAISNELKRLLLNAGYEACILENFAFANFTLAKEEIQKASPDMILLDINIPELNGELLLKEIRRDSDIPVIMVTGNSGGIDEAISISYGADDYIIKPYNPTILLLRIQNIFKRVGQKTNILQYREIEVVQSKGVLKMKDKELLLTKNEMIIFLHLLGRVGNIVTRDELITDLWDSKEYVNDNTLTVNISRLRTKLAELGYDDAIVTRKGLGYILL